MSLNCLLSARRSKYTPSSISPTPEEQVEVGTNISIQCWNQGYQGTISLHQGGHSAPVQHRNTSGGGMATFTLFGVTPANTSIYWCFYHIADTYLLPSALGGRVMLKVTWGPAPPGRSEPPIWVPLVSPMGRSVSTSHPQGLFFQGCSHSTSHTPQVLRSPMGIWWW